MARINWGRIVLGGVLTAIVLVALGSAFSFLFIGRRELQTALQALRPSAGGAVAPLFFIIVFAVLGMLMTLSYAAIRPRFGAGPKTAALAGFGIWLTGVWLSLAGFAIKSLVLGESVWLPSGPVLPCVCLLILIAGNVVGASVYHELAEAKS